jgi:SAM-dependent methyltransferase
LSLASTNREKHIPQVWQLLKPGGVFIAVEPVLNTPHNFIVKNLSPESASDYLDWEEFHNLGGDAGELVVMEGFFVLLPIYFLLKSIRAKKAIKWLLYFEKKLFPAIFDRLAMLEGVVFRKVK